MRTRSTSACRARKATAAGPIVALPWSDFVDNRVLRASPRDYLDVYIDTFDYLHNHEPGGLINVAIHAHFGGRPLIVAQFQKLLRYFSELQRRLVPHPSRGGAVVPAAGRRQPVLPESLFRQIVRRYSSM